MLLKDKCMAKTRHEFAFSKLRRYVNRSMSTSLKIAIVLIGFVVNGCSTDSGLVTVNNHVHCTTHSSCSSHIRDRILTKWESTRNMNGSVGKIVFKLWLSEFGTVEDIKKIKSSGNEEVDNNALGAVNYASPFLELARIDILEPSKYSEMVIVFDPGKHDVTVNLT